MVRVGDFLQPSTRLALRIVKVLVHVKLGLDSTDSTIQIILHNGGAMKKRRFLINGKSGVVASSTKSFDLYFELLHHIYFVFTRRKRRFSLFRLQLEDD